jgi:hypothetical protein
MLHRICFCLLGIGLLLLAACAPSETPSEAIDPYQPASYIKIQHPE